MSGTSDASTPGLSRRRYLALAGAAAGASGFAAAPARGQANATATNGTDGGNRITRRIVIPEIERFAGEYGQDKFVHVLGSTGVSLDWAEFDRCGFADWSPENTTALRMAMIDSLRDYPRPVETAGFARVDGYEPLEPGSLFVVNDVVQCPGRYVGLEVEWFSGDVGPISGEGEETGVLGPGFGAAGAIGGLAAGVAAYLARAGRD